MDQRSPEEFFGSLDNSVPAVFIFAEHLHRQGITVLIYGLKKRGINGVPHDYKDEGDLFIVHDDGTKDRIEVKNIDTQFTCREDFPFPSIIVSNKNRVDKTKHEVKRWVIISKDRKHFASINVNTQNTWAAKDLFAKNSKQKEWFYLAPLDVVQWYKIGENNER